MEQEDQSSKRLTKSGQQVGAENVERLRGYINKLLIAGSRLPSRNGRPDKSAIALACGFDRQTFYNNPDAKALLEKAIGEIGLDVSRKIPDGKTDHLEQLVNKRERRIQHLEERLETTTAELTYYKQENAKLRERLRQYEIIEEVMTTNGRRFRP